MPSKRGEKGSCPELAISLLLLATAACAAPLEVTPRVTGVGIVTGLPIDAMMPTIAENRALDSLRKMLRPGAVRFTYESAAGFALLETNLPESPLVSGGAEIVPVTGGWMALATAVRPPTVVDAMRRLEKVRVSAEVDHPNLGKAMKLAESRAIRTAVRARAIARGGGEGRYKGSLTVAAMRVTLRRRGVRVEMLMHVDVKEHQPINDQERRRILTAVASERRKAREWKSASEPLEKAIELFPNDAELHALVGEIYLRADERDDAAEAFARAMALAPRESRYAERRRVAMGEDERKAPESRKDCRPHGEGSSGGQSSICGDSICTADGHCAVAFWGIDAGGSLTCGITLDGSVVCWGVGGEHALNDPSGGELTRLDVGRDHACGIDTDGEIECWGNDDQGQSSPPDGRFVQVSAGGRHTCGLAVDGAVLCWGDDSDGQATAPEGKFVSVSAGEAHTCAIGNGAGLTVDGTVLCWGDDSDGQAAAPEGKFVSVSAGEAYTCAIGNDAGLACWGRGTSADGCHEPDWQCGQASPPEGIFTQVSAGSHHTCGIRSDGFTVCWGRNDAAQTDVPIELP
ncbi:MAG: hypothetical protein V3T05_05385 [Myxococcota bacterium]